MIPSPHSAGTRKVFTTRDFSVRMCDSVKPLDTLRDGMLGVRDMFTERNISREQRWNGA